MNDRTSDYLVTICKIAIVTGQSLEWLLSQDDYIVSALAEAWEELNRH